jgi:hypothetical protein
MISILDVELILHPAQLIRKSAQEYQEEIIKSFAKFTYVMITVFVHKRDEILTNRYQSSCMLLRYSHFIIYPAWGKIDDFRPGPLFSMYFI